MSIIFSDKAGRAVLCILLSQTFLLNAGNEFGKSKMPEVPNGLKLLQAEPTPEQQQEICQKAKDLQVSIEVLSKAACAFDAQVEAEKEKTDKETNGKQDSLWTTVSYNNQRSRKYRRSQREQES